MKCNKDDESFLVKAECHICRDRFIVELPANVCPPCSTHAAAELYLRTDKKEKIIHNLKLLAWLSLVIIPIELLAYKYYGLEAFYFLCLGIAVSPFAVCLARFLNEKL